MVGDSQSRPYGIGLLRVREGRVGAPVARPYIPIEARQWRTEDCVCLLLQTRITCLRSLAHLRFVPGGEASLDCFTGFFG